MGLVTLSGPILEREAGALFASVRRVPGVSGIDDHLVVHAHPGSVPSLQGTGRRRGGPSDRFASDTTPLVRAAALVGGGLLVLYGLTRGSATGLALASLGAGLATRGARRASRNAGSERSAVSSERPSRDPFEATESAGEGTV